MVVEKSNYENKVNGLILSNVNPSSINSIRLSLNDIVRLHHRDKFEVQLLTKKISENTIYINFNDSKFDVDPNCYLSAHRLSIKLIVDFDEEYVNFKIGYFTNNMVYYSHGDLVTQMMRFNVRYLELVSLKWKDEVGMIEDDYECPVMFKKIDQKYVQCHQCNKKFDYSLVKHWIKPKKNCPMCKTEWQNKIIYSITSITSIV